MLKFQNIEIKFQTILRYSCLLLFFPFIVVIALLIKLLRPVILIRWNHLDNSRIGHFATNIEIYLLKKKFGIDMPNENYIDFFYKPMINSCNIQLEKMWKKKIIIVPWFIIYPLEIFRRKKFLFKDENTFELHSIDRDNLLDNNEPILSFSAEEKKKRLRFFKKNRTIGKNKICMLTSQR